MAGIALDGESLNSKCAAYARWSGEEERLLKKY